MRLLDRDIIRAHALVADPNGTSRSILAAQLADLGLASVVQCGRLADTRRRLELQRFDVIVCEQDFGAEGTGQQLLDELRRNQLLPLSSVFIMVTGEASYAKVTEAAESALDSYLVKPHSATALAERLRQARLRKKLLQDIFSALDEGRFDDALTFSLARWRSRGDYAVFSARVAAELMLNAGRHEEARELFQALLAERALPWASLGVARAQLAGNENAKAVQTLKAALDDTPGFVDALDVLGRVQLEQGLLDSALESYRQAAALTPGSVGRAQRLGMLAFYMGGHEEAVPALERAVTLGLSSKMFDPQALVLLAFLRVRQSDTKGVQRCADNLNHLWSQASDNPRLQRCAQVATVLLLVQLRREAEWRDATAALCADTGSDSFDIEAAFNLLHLLALLAAAGQAADGAEECVARVSARHCTSRSLTELLGRAVLAHASYAERIRDSQRGINEAGEAAMAHSLAGDPASAVRLLLYHAQVSLNAKLIDTARAVLQKHRPRIADAATLEAALESLRQRSAGAPGRLPLGEGQRKPGSMALRTAVPLAEAARGGVPA